MYANGALVAPSLDGQGNMAMADDEEDENAVTYAVDTATLMGLKQFYDKDADIQICRRRKLHATFRPEWSVGLWDEAQEHELQRLGHLNSERVKRLLRAFLSEAHDYLVLFGFVGYYCVKDMPSWLEQRAEEEYQTECDDELPFGVIRLGLTQQDTYGVFKLVQRQGSTQRRMVFRCTDEHLARRYEFYVFEQQPNFEPLQQERRLNDPNADLVVLTPFMELYNRRCVIEEARTCLMDANYMASHPESFVVAKPLPEQRTEMLPEEVRYAFDNISMAQQANNLRRIELSTALANGQKDALQQSSRRQPIRGRVGTLSGTGIDARGGASLYSERKSVFVRPDMKESLEVLPESMDLARGPPPVTLVSVEELQLRYESELCSLMDFPQCFLRLGQSGGGGGATKNKQQESKSGEAGLVFAQKQLEEEVEKQQTLFHELFVEAYERTFGALERQLDDECEKKTKSKRQGTVRLHFENVASKTDQAIISLLPLVQLGILGDDEFRRMILRNFGGLDEEETAQARAERKKRLTAATMPQKPDGESRSKVNPKKKKKKESAKKKTTTTVDEGEKKKHKASSSSSSASSSSEKKTKKRHDSSSSASGSDEKKTKKKHDSSSSASGGDEKKTKKKKRASSSSSSDSKESAKKPGKKKQKKTVNKS